MSYFAYFAVFLGCFSAGMGACLAEEEVLQPESTPVAKTVSAEELVRMMRTEQELQIIDARITSGRKKGYLEGSFHLPDIETNCETLKNTVPTSSTPVVFYCSSEKCGRSLNAVTIAMNCGYSNLFWFRGGFAEWKAKGYPYVLEHASGD